MARSVKVVLEADVEGYKVPIIGAKEETEKLDNKVEALNRDLDKTPAAATRAAAAMKLAGGNAGAAADRFKQFSEATDDAGNKINKSITFSKFLSAELDRAKNSVKNLGDEFKKTGDKNVLGELINAKAIVKDLEKVQKGVEDAISTGGKEGAKNLSASLQGVLSNPVLGPLSVGAIAGLAAILSPAIAAAIGAAVIGSGGLAAIGLGIASQIQSPAVQSAFGQLKQRAVDDLTAAGSAFQPVLINGLHGFSNELDKIQGQVSRNLSKLAGPTAGLFAGVNEAIDKLGPGIDALTTAAAPFIEELGADIPRVASALSRMFQDISAEAPGAIVFFHDLISVIDGFIIATGKFVEGGEKAYGLIRIFTHGLSGDAAGAARDLANLHGEQDATAESAKKLKTNMEVAAASIDLAGGKAMSASDQYGSLISQLKATNNTADKVAGAMVDAIINPMLQADIAANNFDKSLVTLGDTLEKNGGHLSEHVKALKKAQTGQQDNKDAILAVVQANLQEYDSQINVGVAATDAAAKYDKNTKALEDQLHAAGYTSAQIDDLIGKYRNVPDKVDTSLAINGLADAINDLDDLIRKINGLHDKNITINEHIYTYQDPQSTFHGFATGGIRRAQVGMLIPPSSPGTVLAGEPQTGGEALIPLRGISQMRAASLGRVAMAGYGLDVVPRGYRSMGGSGGGKISITLYGGDDLTSAMLGRIRAEVRTGFGGNVQVALGRG